MRLLDISRNAEYVAFCDQDDYWDPNKLQVLIASMKGEVAPKLVFSARRLMIDNKDSKRVIPSPDQINFRRNSIVENVAAGNSQILNRKAVELILSFDCKVKHFDSWIYLILSQIAQVNFVRDPLVSYRIHSGNQVGIRSNTSLRKARKALEYYGKQANEFFKQLSENMQYVDLEKQQIVYFIESLTSKYILRRWYFLFKSKAKRSKKLDQFYLYLLLIRRIKITD
jgi:hypothetical protein